MKRIIPYVLLIVLSFILFFNCDEHDTHSEESYLLTINVEKTGIVTIMPDNITLTKGTYEFKYDNGTIITLKSDSINSINKSFNYIYEIPDSAASQINKWSGDLSGTASEQVLVMDSDKTITADFNLSGITRSDIRYTEDDALYMIQVFVYDKDGFIKKLSQHDDAGGFINSYSYYFNDEERLIRISYINNPDSIENDDFEYDESGKLIKIISYGTRELIEYKTFNYNENGQLISITQYDDLDVQIENKIIDYFESGEILQIRNYDSENILLSYTDLLYNESKILDTVNCYNSTGELLKVLLYEHENPGEELVLMDGAFNSEFKEEFSLIKYSSLQAF